MNQHEPAFLTAAASDLRPLIKDVETDNIADLAVRANALPDVIRLWYGEGDVTTPAFICDAAAAALRAGQTFYVPDMRGSAELVTELSRYQSALHGKDIGEDRATVTPGGMQALHLAMLLTCEPGKRVVYLEPQWPNIRHAIALAGGRPVPVPLGLYGARPALDLDRLFAACEEGSAAIVFSSPSNPTGWTASREELSQILAFARRRGIWIIADEVYARLWFGKGRAAPSILQLAEPEDRVLTVNSFSKAWAMTGWRVGWLSHPPSVQPTLAAVTQYVNSGTAAFVQVAAATALSEGEAFVAFMRERCRQGLDAAYATLAAAAELHEAPHGGMYAFFRLAGEDDSRAACRAILEKARVGVAPGYMFGEVARPFLRLCVCRDAKTVREAGERIRAALA